MHAEISQSPDSPRIPLSKADKSYVTRYGKQRLDRLVTNAEDLLQQAVASGQSSDVTVLELPAGGYYFVTGSGHDMAAMQQEHGARAAWQVKNLQSSVVVTGRSGDRTCLLQSVRPGGRLVQTLRDAPAYLLV